MGRNISAHLHQDMDGDASRSISIQEESGLGQTDAFPTTCTSAKTWRHLVSWSTSKFTARPIVYLPSFVQMLFPLVQYRGMFLMTWMFQRPFPYQCTLVVIWCTLHVTTLDTENWYCSCVYDHFTLAVCSNCSVHPNVVKVAIHFAYDAKLLCNGMGLLLDM